MAWSFLLEKRVRKGTKKDIKGAKGNGTERKGTKSDKMGINKYRRSEANISPVPLGSGGFSVIAMLGTKCVFVRNFSGIMMVQVIEKLIRGRTVSTGCRRVELHTQDAGWPGKSFRH